MSLTGKDRRQLKARGQTMADDVRLGKGGLSDAFINHVNELLAQRELVKLRFTDLQGKARKDLADQICAAIDAQCISIVGRTMLLYRPNPDLDDDKRVLKS